MRMVKIYLKKYISPEEGQEVTDDLRLKEQYKDGMKSHKSFKNEKDGEIIKKIPKERYIYPEERQKIIDNLNIIV